MRKIKIEKWKSQSPQGEKEESLLTVLNVIIANKHPNEMPKGLEKFKLFSKLSKAFEKAEDTNELVLEDTEYEFLKESIENNIPSIWGMNSNISKAIDAFFEAKEVM
ncbi:MAG: hypothetical protein ACTSR2_06995 [Candidatus Hodarchaeales archaeon]